MATQKNNISSKYKDIISRVVISSKSLAVYQLRTKKEKTGPLTRMTVGEKNTDKTNKTILLLGETGTGKSTLINALINYTMGVKWDDEVWFQIVEEKKRNQTENQTLDVIVYEIFGFEDETLPYSLTIIDTPGYGNIMGTKKDDVINQKLLDLFRLEGGVHEVHAVGLVIKASDNQLNDRLMFVFDSLMSLFGEDLEKNIVALITYSDGMPPKNALTALEHQKIKCAKNEKNQSLYFLFNNQQNKERTDENEFGLETAWRVTERGVRQFTDFLEESEAQKLETTFEDLNERIRLTACIQNLQDRMKFIDVKQREIKNTQEALKKPEERKMIEDFTPRVAEVFKHKEPIRGGMCGLEAAVCCTVCEENCHYPGCTLSWKPENCKVMKDGHCTVCTKKCPPLDHVREKWRYVTRLRDAKKKKVFEFNKTEPRVSILNNLEKEMNKLTTEKLQLLDEAYQHVVRLDQMDLNVNSVNTSVHLDFLIKKMKEKGEREKIQKLEEIESQVDEETRAALQHRINLISPPYEDISSDSFLIYSGPPAVYQLRPKKQKFGTLTRMTLGEKDFNKINKTILLVGETGGGKSTLINTLINHTMGVKWEDEVWFQIVEEEMRSQAESQTSDVIVYEIFGFENQILPYSLTIIDTPGYGDTRGTDHDNIIGERLLDLFRSEDGVHEINSVGLVMKATDNRLSDRQSYIFNSVISLFGKNVEKSIVALITHSDGMPPENALEALEAASIECARNEKNEPVHFLFDNQQSKERRESYENSLLKSWDLTKKQMGDFLTFLSSCGPQRLMKTKKVLKKRIKLKASIQNLKERINLIELKQREIRQIQEGLKKHKETMNANENFTVEVDEVYVEKEDIKGGMWGVFYEGALCCTVCMENCHYPGCSVSWYPSHCEVIKDERCTVCIGKCAASKHVKEKWRYVNKTKTVKKTMEEMKVKYETNKNKSQNLQSLLENLEKEMSRLTAEKSQLLDESYQHFLRLDELALKIDSESTTVHYLDFLIEKMEEKGDTDKVQKLEEMRRRVDEGTRGALK
ncbi:uncharacterized protein LOC102290918 [Haplochromis burtoni]|uniref:Uncharacterized LOC102290918 n=2 Tax=Haplochromis burtoni TaxID=8153 RepID=A0A3Q2VS80_HAPBU|nr:uncharacterized protein LOC102290918 [Haplochromis burtoni]